METGRELAERAARGLAASSRTSPTAAGPTEAPDPDRIDAINQVFALFRLNYHNQYYRAFEDAAQLAQAKKLWFEGLAAFDRESILRGARACIEGSEYLPTLHRMIGCCREAQYASAGLPDPGTAYREAAGAPREGHRWSHPAVAHAARATGLQRLAMERESEVLAAFETHYREACERVLRGESLALPPASVSASAPAEMSLDSRRAALRALRREAGV